MNTHLLQLRSALERSQEPQTLDLLELPEPDEGLSPWAAWLLVGLIRHRDRQRWLAETIEIRLNADLGALAEFGAFAHPDVPPNGLVPGDTDWEYYFHGRGCCLSHRITGEKLDVDFHDETAEWFDDYFYIRYLESLRSPEFAEQRLMELHPTMRTIKLSFKELVEQGLLETHPESKVVRLHPDCVELDECLERLEHRWRDSQHRIRIAAALGDWLLVEQELRSTDPVWPQVSSRATRCRDLRFARLKRLYELPDPRAEVLEAIADLDHPELPDLLEHALEGEPSGIISAALKIIAHREEPRWIKAVHRLFRRVDPNGAIPEPHIWKTCAEYLARNGEHITEVKNSLKLVQSHELGEAALMAMEYAPEMALGLFRRALRSTIPCNRITAAASLAIIDEPWCRDELIAILQESDDQEATAECRSALLLTRDPGVHRVVEEWETRNPHEPELGQWISMREHSLRSCGAFVQYEMEKLHDRVLPMRGQPSPDLPAETSPWWWPFRLGNGS